MEKEKAIIIRPPLELTSLEDLRAQTRQLGEMYKALMQEGTDYGIVPGTDKPTLLKPGAELLRLWTKLSPQFAIDSSGTDLKEGIFNYEIRCSLLNQGGDIVCEGVGSCNSLESKYRFRWIWPNEIPEGMDKTKIVSKRFKTKKGDFTTKYRLDNDNPQDLANTILKMAKKRAFVDAMLTVTGASRIFTQDMEDSVEHEVEEGKAVATAASITKPPVVKPTVAQEVKDLYGPDAVKPPDKVAPALENAKPAASAPPGVAKPPSVGTPATDKPGVAPEDMLFSDDDYSGVAALLLPHGLSITDVRDFAKKQDKGFVGFKVAQDCWDLAIKMPGFKKG